MHCTNINHPKIIDWAMEFNKSPEYIGGIVSLWQESNNRLDEFPSKLWMEEQIKSSNKENEVSFALKSVDILSSQKADEIFRKGDKNNWDINKILTELKIPKEQKELLLSFNTRNREEILTNLLANYSYTVEINTAKEDKIRYEDSYSQEGELLGTYPIEEGKTDKPTQHYSNLTVPGGTNYTENKIETPTIVPSIQGHPAWVKKDGTDKGIGWFRSDEKVNISYINRKSNESEFITDFTLNGNNYREDSGDIIIYYKNNIKISFAEFEKAKEDYRFNEKNITNKEDLSLVKDLKTRRILELQSDLFQKGREEVNLIQNNQMLNRDLLPVLKQAEDKLYKLKEEQSINDSQELVDKIKIQELFINNTKKSLEKNKERALLDKSNQFLQLLNKDNNWVTFFIKSIIQSTAKQTVTEVQQEDVEAKVRELERNGLLKIKCD